MCTAGGKAYTFEAPSFAFTHIFCSTLHSNYLWGAFIAWLAKLGFIEHFLDSLRKKNCRRTSHTIFDKQSTQFTYCSKCNELRNRLYCSWDDTPETRQHVKVIIVEFYMGNLSTYLGFANWAGSKFEILGDFLQVSEVKLEEVLVLHSITLCRATAMNLFLVCKRNVVSYFELGKKS